MLSIVRQSGAWLLHQLEAAFDAAFGREHNPFYQLGALTVYFFWVVLVSGIYVFIFFRTSVDGAYESVEQLTHGQWYAGGVMRSLHRYASDAAVVTIALHLLREFLLDRYRGPRWFSWFTGVPLLWLVFPLGITGYWLVWDQLAVHVAVVSAELMDWLPLFTDPMARNFLTMEGVSDRFFTLLAFIHLIGLPIFLVFGIWFHVLRITQPEVNPSRSLMIGSLAMLVVLSLAAPALSQAPADLALMPRTTDYDWFYLLMYPLHEATSAGVVWGVLVGTSLLISVLPWLPPAKRAPVAEVDPANCNGCRRCFADCPYSAITMAPRETDDRHAEIAVVDPDLCVSCGICAGACPSATPFRSVEDLTSGIDMPGADVHDLRKRLQANAETLTQRPHIVVFGCAEAASLVSLGGTGTVTHAFPCIGNLPPSFVDYCLRRLDFDGVFVTGCPPADCHHRLGSQWLEQRFAAEREPRLKGRVDGRRVRVHWARRHEQRNPWRAYSDFRDSVAALERVQAEEAGDDH